jgi:hypothetical protein
MIRTMQHALDVGLAILAIAVLCATSLLTPDPWADWGDE